jgi:hypothetical protein
MVHARAASQMAVSIPFGAAHRVNFDTPPLKGSCRYTAVYQPKNQQVNEIRYTAVYGGLEVNNDDSRTRK